MLGNQDAQPANITQLKITEALQRCMAGRLSGLLLGDKVAISLV